MKNITAIVAGSAMALLSAGPALAQATPANRGGDPRGSNYYANLVYSERLLEDPAKASHVYSVGLGIARCMVNIGGEKTAELLGGPNTDDASYRNLTRALQRRYSSCMRDQGLVPPIVVNYALAEMLLLRDNPGFEDRARAVNVDEADAFQGASDEQVTMDHLARCLSVYSPGLAHKVVATSAASTEQTAALETLYGQTPECAMSAPPADIPPDFQRGALAVALYQWTHRSS